MKRLQVVRVDSQDGDSHFILLDYSLSKENKYTKDYDEANVKKASKKEASKPLILDRS
jgi:hypothetical protein